MDRDDDGDLYWTGKHSRVYGGRWDTWKQRQSGPAESILYVPCSSEQFEFVEADGEIIEGAGGRGSGKSEGGVLKACRNICERPLERGRIVVPGPVQQREMWGKLLDFFVETGWIRPGLRGVKESKGELHFIHGVVLQLISAHKPHRLRSWGGGWAMVDEGQDVTTEAVDILIPSLRLAGDLGPQIFFQLTPKLGDCWERHKAWAEEIEEARQRGAEPAAVQIVFNSYSNCFIDHRAFNMSKRRTAKAVAEVEIDASWERIAEQAEALQDKPVFGVFDRDVHTAALGTHYRLEGWHHSVADITNKVATSKLRGVRGYNWQFIAGIDPNGAVPNYCTIYKVFEPAEPGFPNRWVAVDFIAAKGHCGHLGQRLKERGYKAREVLIVPDFSSRYNKLNNPKSSSALLRGEGFYVVHGPKNPYVRHSIEDWLAKLDPVEGEPSWFAAMPQCAHLVENIETVLWNKDGDGFDKSIRPDPVDSARYPISYFEPAMRFKKKQRWKKAA